MLFLILLGIVAIWTIIALPLAFLIGKSIRLADDTAKRPASEKEAGRFASGDRARQGVA